MKKANMPQAEAVIKKAKETAAATVAATDTPETLDGEIAVINGGQVVAFNKTEAALADLKKRFSGVRYAVELPEVMKEAKAAHKEIAGYRIALEKRRKELKAPVLERGRLIDSEAERITAELVALEKPIKLQIDAEEKRLADIKAEAERKERERVEALQLELSFIRSLPSVMIGKASADIQEKIDYLSAYDVSKLAEFAEAGRLAVGESLKLLSILHAQAVATEAAKPAPAPAPAPEPEPVPVTKTAQNLKEWQKTVEAVGLTLDELTTAVHSSGRPSRDLLVSAVSGAFLVDAETAAEWLIAEFGGAQ